MNAEKPLDSRLEVVDVGVADPDVTLQLTNTMLRVIAAGNPIHGLVSQLATLVHGAAIIYDADGLATARAGEAPAQLIWNEIQEHSTAELDLTIGRWRVKTRRLSLSIETHVIAIASRTPSLIEHPGATLLDISERLLSTIHGLQYSSQLRERRNNQHLLMTLQDGIPPSREHRYWTRLTQFQFPSYVRLYAFELTPKDGRSATENDIAHVIRHARNAQVPHLVGLRRIDATSPATITGIVPEDTRVRQVLDVLEPNFNVGVSAPFNTLVRVPDAKREAEIALSIAIRRSRADAPGNTVQMDLIDLATWLLSRVSDRMLGDEVSRTLAPLEDHDTLTQTLVVYLASGQSVARTAKHLYLHQNTVRYRIAKVEEAFGHSLADAITLTNVTLALYEDILDAQRVLRATNNLRQSSSMSSSMSSSSSPSSSSS